MTAGSNTDQVEGSTWVTWREFTPFHRPVFFRQNLQGSRPPAEAIALPGAELVVAVS